MLHLYAKHWRNSVIANRFRCVARGAFDAGTWVGEEAQIGFSGVMTDVDADWAAPAIDTPLRTFTANPGGGIETVGGLGVVNYGAEGPGESGFNKANQKAIAAAFRVYLDALKSYWSASFKWTEIRLSAFDPAGDVINGATVVVLEAPVAGTDASQDLPPQTAIVQTLMSNGRGPRNRGRWYVPAHSSAPVSTGGTVNGAVMNGMNTNAKALWTTVGALPHVFPAIVSAQHQSFSQVVSFKVGNRFDTQRRRSGGLRETFNSLAN